MTTAAEGEGGWELKVGWLNSAEVEFAVPLCLSHQPRDLLLFDWKAGRQEGA
jgi:hypothetical protein